MTDLLRVSGPAMFTDCCTVVTERQALDADITAKRDQVPEAIRSAIGLTTQLISRRL